MQERINKIIELHSKLNPEIKVDRKTLIKGTSIEKLCEYPGPGYYRVLKWMESKVLVPKKTVKFSGEKVVYEGGATRDIIEGKGRYDLIDPKFLKRLAIVLEEGAKNHGEENWKNGMPFNRLIDSTKRHINQFHEGLKDEDHLIHAVANIMFLCFFEEEGRLDLDNIHKK